MFDLSLWIDADVLSNSFFGTTVEELKCLYDLFVMRKRYDRKGNEIDAKPANDCISSSWTLLLSKFSKTQLHEILEVAPKLQPALPKDFCKKNAGSLTDKYGMPDVEICKLYCLDKISNTGTISQYKNIKHKLFVYSHCGATHLEGEGTPMCKLGKRRINNLAKRLEEQYEKIIKQDIIAQFTQLCKDSNLLTTLLNASNDEFNNIGEFLERCSNLKNNFFRYKICEDILESYELLPQLFKKALTPFFCSCVNSSAIAAAKDKDSTPFMLGYHIEKLGDWVTDSTKQLVKELVNDRFANLDDLDELNEAFKTEYITKDQYLRKYQQLTCEYNAYQFMTELSKYKSSEFPSNIQWYVVSRIIKLLGYKNLCSFDYIELENGSSVSGIRSLLKWFGFQKEYGRIETEILLKAEEEICSILSDDDRWTLFEEKLSNPQEKTIYGNVLKKLTIKRRLIRNSSSITVFRILCCQMWTMSAILIF